VFLYGPPPPSFDIHKHNGDDEPEDVEVIFKNIFFSEVPDLCWLYSAIPNKILVFSLTGYNKDNKFIFTHIHNATEKRTFAAFVGQIV
jgi:hypothetical protein